MTVQPHVTINGFDSDGSTLPTAAQRADAEATVARYAARTRGPLGDDLALARLARLTKRRDPMAAARIMNKRGYWNLRPTQRRDSPVAAAVAVLDEGLQRVLDHLYDFFGDRDAR